MGNGRGLSNAMRVGAVGSNPTADVLKILILDDNFMVYLLLPTYCYYDFDELPRLSNSRRFITATV